MGKSLYIAEKPSVAEQFAAALAEDFTKQDGYMESGNSVITWCVGHLVVMCYPEAYNPELKKWRFDTIPFIPEQFKYQVDPKKTKQFGIVSRLLNREDVDTIYIATDSGREGEYIYRLVDQESHVTGKTRKRVWIDSQTNEEILRGIREAKDMTEYDNLSDSAYLRAKEDYLMGINFSRVLSLKYGRDLTNLLGGEYQAIAVGRVMTCVLGMIVSREREIRNFVKTPFYKVQANLDASGGALEALWKVNEKSKYNETPFLYKDNGFVDIEHAKELVSYVSDQSPLYDEENNAKVTALNAIVDKIEKKTEKKNPPLLYNLADLQTLCSKLFKIGPDETLQIIQDLYEKKLCTYPRTDARVLSSAVAKEIGNNLKGLSTQEMYRPICAEISASGSHKGIEKTKYTNDKMITDHYAIIPTGQGFGALKALSETHQKVFEVICRRFLAIFMPPAEYKKVALTVKMKEEVFSSNFKMLEKPGYLGMMTYSFSNKDMVQEAKNDESKKDDEQDEETVASEDTMKLVSTLKKGDSIPVDSFKIKEGETKPPQRYTSGSIISAMESAGKMIEDEELRAQIKGAGIGTSATRGEIYNKLVSKGAIEVNKKTQILTPSLRGEVTYDIVRNSINPLLSADLTASWEKGLTGVAEGEVKSEEYMKKLSDYVTKYTNYVKGLNNRNIVQESYNYAAPFYKKSSKKK